MASSRQRAARVRNFNKMRLKGIRATLSNLNRSKSFSVYDKQKLFQAYELVTSVLVAWDKDFIKRRSDEEAKLIAKESY